MKPTTDPHEWRKRLDTIDQAYRGWAAAFIWWRYADPSPRMAENKKAGHHKVWARFKVDEVPSDIPLSLCRVALDEQLAQIGYKRWLGAKKAAAARLSNQRAKSLRARVGGDRAAKRGFNATSGGGRG